MLAGWQPLVRFTQAWFIGNISPAYSLGECCTLAAEAGAGAGVFAGALAGCFCSVGVA